MAAEAKESLLENSDSDLYVAVDDQAASPHSSSATSPRRSYAVWGIVGLMAVVAVVSIAVVETQRTDSSSDNSSQASSSSVGDMSKVVNQRQLFDAYKARYRPSGYVSDAEEQLRFNIFKQNVLGIDARNRAEGTTSVTHFDYTTVPETAGHGTLAERLVHRGSSTERFPNVVSSPPHGITMFSDFSPGEFRAMQGLALPANISKPGRYDQPSSRRAGTGYGYGPGSATCTKNWVTELESQADTTIEIRNQGQCGSCWIFSTLENLRMQYINAGNPDPGELSTQYVVDCWNVQGYSATTSCNKGTNFGTCCGGLPYELMEWISDNGGVPTKAAYGNNGYSYTALYGTTDSGNTGKPSTCKSVSMSGGITLSKAEMIGTPQFTSEKAMLDHICNHGPITIGVSAVPALESYQPGTILTSASCSGTVDHAVQLMGVSEDGDYWIVRNSWGESWGNKGYFYMKYGENTCNIQSAGYADAYASGVTGA